jgi:UDP-glucuronate decarboxylase
MRTLAEKVVSLTGSTSPVVMCPLPPDDPRQRQPDISKAQTILGWSPAVQLEAGLERTIEYFRSFV